jgi:hypothetical protein
MEWLKDWFWWVFDTITGFFVDVCDAIMGFVVSALPDAWTGAGTTIGGAFGAYWTIANTWLPLSEVIGLYASMVAFQCVLIGVRWLLKVVRGA